MSGTSAARRCSTRASATSPRTGSAAGSCSSSRSPRTSRSTTTPSRPTRSGAGSSRSGSSSGRGALIQEFDVRGGGPLTRARRRSPAATSRRSSLAREIARDPRVLIAAQPTRGLDVGAIEYLHRRLVEERDEGRAILLDLARARGDAVALRPHPRHLRGPRSSASTRRRRPRRRSASRCSAAGGRRRSHERQRPRATPPSERADPRRRTGPSDDGEPTTSRR